MKAKKLKLTPRQKRKFRIRKRVSGTEERPRMSVFRSAKHIYVQVIDDVAGATVAATSTLSPSLREGLGDNKTLAAKTVGTAIAELCKAKNVTQVAFDRNGFRYHGRIKALADAAREAGLDF